MNKLDKIFLTCTQRDTVINVKSINILYPGSYICDCLDTFVRDRSNECVCADGYENQDGSCVDIDECADDPCGENEVIIYLNSYVLVYVTDLKIKNMETKFL